MAGDNQRSPTWLGSSLKHVSIALLILQNSILILVMHYSRIMPLVDGQRYLPSTAIFTSELMKLAISLTMALYDIASRQPNAAATMLFQELFTEIFSGDGWKLAVIAILYTLQNTLQYLAVSNLSASTFQITYQLKILTTAVFSIALLNRSISVRKWISLFFLTIGVATVQVPGSSPSEDWSAIRQGSYLNYWLPKTLSKRNFALWTALSGPTLNSVKRSATYQGINEDFALHHPRLNRMLGLAAVIAACTLSGLSGVYFEKVLKDHGTRTTRSGSRTHISLWVRNVQLSFYSLFPALLLAVAWKDGDQIARYGFWSGYNWVVWLTIVLQAFGGVVVALVINYADNIAKNFATSISIVLSLVASVYYFDQSLSFEYLLGTLIVVAATWLYNAPEGGHSPALLIEDYEKQQKTKPEQGYFDLITDSPRIPRSPLRGDDSFTSSRPSSPHPESQHFRSAGTRRQFDKREL